MHGAPNEIGELIERRVAERTAELERAQVLPMSKDELEAAAEQAVAKIKEQLEHPGVVIENDVSADRTEEIFQHLEECGLLVRGHRVEERAEQLAQERLQALKAEHGLNGSPA